MTSNNKKWKKVFDGDGLVFWRTPERKNGEYGYVFSSRGLDMFFTAEEFSEFIYAVNQVNDSLCKPGDCYQ